MDYKEIETKYKPKLPYPSKPDRPSLSRSATAAETRKHADLLEIYEVDMKAYQTQKDAYNEDTAKLQEQFKKDLFEELNITNNPKKEKLYSLAWDYGHSSGLYEVYLHADKLVELID